MFSKIQFQTLFSYHWHTTSRLIASTEHLSEDDYFLNPGYGHGSIHELLFHLLRTDQAWRLGLETGKQLPPLAAKDFKTLESLKVGVEQEKAAWEDLLERLSPAEIEGSMEIANRHGAVFTFPRWRILQHLILHGMQHFAEIAQILTAKGRSPGNLDFIFFE